MSARHPGAKPFDIEGLSIDHLRDVVGRVLAESREIAAAYAFGSRIGGRPVPSSDLDLAFVAWKEADITADPLLAERLTARIVSELDSSMEIDGHLADRLPLNVRGRVVTECLLLYEADPERRVDFEISTRRLYFDFLPFIERDAREALLGGG